MSAEHKLRCWKAGGSGSPPPTRCQLPRSPAPRFVWKGRGRDGGQTGYWEKKKHDQNRKFIEGRVAFLSFSSRLESGDTTQVSRVEKISQGTTKVISVIGQSSSFKALYPVVQQQDRLSPPKILLGKGTKSKAVARRSQRT